MFSDRIFQITFLISLIAHAVILAGNPNFRFLPTPKVEKNLEVRYVQEPKKAKPELKPVNTLKNEPFLKIPPKITLEKKIPPPFIDKEAVFGGNKTPNPSIRQVTFDKPAFAKPDIIAIKKKITFPPVDLDKIDNPSYISYYQIVREKIKRSAYESYTRQETGDVYLSFVISGDGYLKEVRLAQERSSPNPYLREIALRSVKDAAPFPNFPKELDYPQLSFNVIISFEIE
jgi:TonB family protein